MADAASEQVVYLHGDLDLVIYEARQLPNMDLASESLRRCFTACDTFKCSSGHTESHSHGGSGDPKVRQHRRIITSDPYVTVCVPQATVARTGVIKNSQNPKWEEHFAIPLAHPVINLEFQVKDNDVFGSQLIGTATISAKRIATGETISEWVPITGSTGKPPKSDTALRVHLKFTPCDKNPMYKHGIAGDPEHKGVRHTFFPVRKGHSVRLYQDAHGRDGMLPRIELDGGNEFGHEKCWEDICYAISEAHHLIYLVGWSIFHKVKLVREPTRPLPRGGDLNLGELLKYKSEEGVRVLLLVWDDKTSHDKYLINTVPPRSLP